MRPQDAIAAARAFQDAIKGEVVTADEIARREKICSACPKRKLTRNFTGRMSQVLGMIANRNRVPNSIRSYSCGVCGCNLMLLIPATEKDQHKDSPAEAKQRPAACWMLAEKKG